MTQNELVFRGIAYPATKDEPTFLGDVKTLKTFNTSHSSNETYLNLWRCIALCHDVLFIHLPGSKTPTLSGSSQDEIQLLHAGSATSFASLLSRDSDSVKISLNGRDEEYKIIKVFEFTSDRKMMSVVVKRVTDGKYLLFTKGADDKVAPLSRDSSVASRIEK